MRTGNFPKSQLREHAASQPRSQRLIRSFKVSVRLLASVNQRITRYKIASVNRAADLAGAYRCSRLPSRLRALRKYAMPLRPPGSSPRSSASAPRGDPGASPGRVGYRRFEREVEMEGPAPRARPSPSSRARSVGGTSPRPSASSRSRSSPSFGRRSTSS